MTDFYDALQKIQEKQTLLDTLKLLQEGSPEQEEMKSQISKALEDCRAKMFGFCAVVSVYLWDQIGQPKNLFPYSVIFAEEEHVILYDWRTGVIVDPTGEQFDQPLFNIRREAPYTKFWRFTAEALDSARKEKLQ